MAVPLSQFVKSDEFIVKQPRVALTNSESTLPTYTRPISQSPVFPPPNNLGEIGSYPSVLGDTTPVGDERTGTATPPDYAIEYIVWVSDEGTGINVSEEETFESIDGWSTTDAGTGLGLSNTSTQGDRSLTFSKGTTDTHGGVVKTVSADYSDYVGKNFFVDLNLDVTALSNTEAFEFWMEDTSGRFVGWEVLQSALSSGWNTLTFSESSANLTTDPLFDLPNVSKIYFKIRTALATTPVVGVKIDDFKGTKTLTGKISSGDVKVKFARNSNWQTRFTYHKQLNRWALISEEIGEISNSPMLSIPSTYINDFLQRGVDFKVSIGGTNLTVSAVANEAAFGAPPSGTVEFARAETTFNFNTDDLSTYSGKQVIYSEIEDGETTVSSSGVATLERSLTMTFQANSILALKDLSLDYTLTSETLSTDLNGADEVLLTFVPTTGTISLNYTPTKSGFPDPLVEGTDFVVDEDVPSIRFTTAVSNETLLDNSPSSPGDKDSSRLTYEVFQAATSNMVPNTVSVTEDSTVLTEDEDFIVDLSAGQVYLTHGLVTETVLGNVFLEDPAFVDVNFTLYINGSETTDFSIVPDTGWVNTDEKLFKGDYITADYITDEEGSEGTSITGEALLSPAIIVPGLSSTQRAISASVPADGGEFSFLVSRPPVRLTRVEIDQGGTSFSIKGDRTADYVSNRLLMIDTDVYQVSSSSYDADNDETTITISSAARRSYVNPDAWYTKSTVSWTTESSNRGNISEGATEIRLTGGSDQVQFYYDGIFIRLKGAEIYPVVGAFADGSDAVLKLLSGLDTELAPMDSMERTTVGIPKEGDTEIQTFYTPIIGIPDRFDPNGDLMSLSDRFSGLGNRSILVTRNSTPLTEDVDYTLDPDGTITLHSAVAEPDSSIVVKYVPHRFSSTGSTITTSYTYYSSAPTGVGLLGTMSYQVPDTFYFRVVSNNSQASIFSDWLEEFIRQKAGQVSSGSSPVVTTSSGNHDRGLETPISRVGDHYDNDFVARRIYEFYTARIGYLEGERTELSGEVPGGFRGPLTDTELEESSWSSGRLFPTDPDVLDAIKKIGEDKYLPSHPYRLPALFGLPVEDDNTRVIMDADYPTLPVVSIPSFPPQGLTYKGSNMEPNFLSTQTDAGVTETFTSAVSAGASATFVENWYPGFLDGSTTHPTSGDGYVTSFSPITVDTTALFVSQDTGDPNDSVPVFPPSDLDLNPDSFEGFDPITFPLPTFASAPPRDTSSIPNSYEAAALGALYSIDDAIEANTLAGTAHRDVDGDPTSYPQIKLGNSSTIGGVQDGFVFPDNNEYDVLTNGASPTVFEMIQTEWTSRGTYTSELTTSCQKLLLYYMVQQASLTRQISYHQSIIDQLDPTPTGDPEATTVAEATTAQAEATTAQAEATTAQSTVQTFYDDVIIGSSGIATDQEIIDFWLWLTGIDATGTPTTDPLPTTGGNGNGRIDQVENRITFIVTRLGQIYTALGFDNTLEPDFSGDSTSEDLYSNRYTYVDLRINRESGTMFKALAQHAQYVRDLDEGKTLLSVLHLLRS